MTIKDRVFGDNSDIQLIKERTFRETPSVHFADISVPGSNGIDLVEHKGYAVSPPSVGSEKRWYVHQNQTDNNRVIKGHRLFELFHYGFEHTHWFVFLTPLSGALTIPPGCFHRSVSCQHGSLLINHAVRTKNYDENFEFRPAEVNPGLLLNPWYHGITEREAQHFLSNGALPAS